MRFIRISPFILSHSVDEKPTMPTGLCFIGNQIENICPVMSTEKWQKSSQNLHSIQLQAITTMIYDHTIFQKAVAKEKNLLILFKSSEKQVVELLVCMHTHTKAHHRISTRAQNCKLLFFLNIYLAKELSSI